MKFTYPGQRFKIPSLSHYSLLLKAAKISSFFARNLYLFWLWLNITCNSFALCCQLWRAESSNAKEAAVTAATLLCWVTLCYFNILQNYFFAQYHSCMILGICSWQRIGVRVKKVLWKFVLAAVAVSTFWTTGARGPFLEMSGNVSGLKSNIQIKIWRYVHTLPDSSCAFAIFITRYILFLVQSFLSNAKRTISSKFLLKITRDCKEKQNPKRWLAPLEIFPPLMKMTFC